MSNTTDWQLSIPGFLIFNLNAPFETADIIVFRKDKYRRLLMQMPARAEHCPV
jgi:hypothetical protein